VHFPLIVVNLNRQQRRARNGNHVKRCLS
jgi:hypothetical protein